LLDLEHPDDGTGYREVASREKDDKVDFVARIHLQSDEQRYRDEENDDVAHNRDGCSGLKRSAVQGEGRLLVGAITYIPGRVVG
jgi:hypothetical protein